jgi:hypothetical protein
VSTPLFTRRGNKELGVETNNWRRQRQRVGGDEQLAATRAGGDKWLAATKLTATRRAGGDEELAAKELAAKELAAKDLAAKDLAAMELAAVEPGGESWRRAQHIPGPSQPGHRPPRASRPT